MFKFKQFSIDQIGCAMKINTDGVLLGALAGVDRPKSILDIGTGTGVMALMLAQRFIAATVDAVEIDVIAAQTVGKNFKNSPFAERLTLFPASFESHFASYPAKKYDLMVSNPPFHLNSLEPLEAKKSLAKHTDERFFERLIVHAAKHLTANGLCWLILPLQAAELVKGLADQHKLYSQKVITIHSFITDAAHREIVCFGLNPEKSIDEKFVIYDKPRVYSEQYRDSLKNFFTIF